MRPQVTNETETYKFINAAKSETTEVPLGPLHITSDEPGHFRLFVDGKDIIDADYRLFYATAAWKSSPKHGWATMT